MASNVVEYRSLVERQSRLLVETQEVLGNMLTAYRSMRNAFENKQTDDQLSRKADLLLELIVHHVGGETSDLEDAEKSVHKLLLTLCDEVSCHVMEEPNFLSTPVRERMIERAVLCNLGILPSINSTPHRVE